ncbi:insulinase family protein [bacterium]|nr:insulinase family protein [bacterium]
MTVQNSQSPSAPLMDLRTLPSGVTFLHDPTFRGEGASVVVLVRTGARDEVSGEFGISHFLEHMVFKGTQHRSALDLTLAFGDLGAQVNAYTSDEQTVFYGTVLNEHVDALHAILLDMMNPLLDDEEFRVEKKVILEEIALYADRPNFVLYEKAVADFFGGVGVGQSVLGTSESVAAIDREQMADYVARRYRRSNMVVSLCGDLHSDFYADLTDTRVQDLPGEEAAGSPKSHSRVHGKTEIFHHEKNTQAHLFGLASGPDAKDPLRYAAGLLGIILGDAQNSRLYWELVDSGLAEYASIDCEDKDGVGCWMLSIAAAPEQWEEVRERAFAVLSDVQKGGVNPTVKRGGTVTEEELDRAKTKCLSRLVMDSELPLGKALASAVSLQYRGVPFVLQHEMESIRNVTREDCQALLERYPVDTMNLYVMLPR